MKKIKSFFIKIIELDKVIQRLSSSNLKRWIEEVWDFAESLIYGYCDTEVAF